MNTAMNTCILVLNCGSSSIKFALFDASRQPLPRSPIWGGKIEGIGGPQATHSETGQPPVGLSLDPANPYHAALEHIERRVLAQPGAQHLAAVAHRVVHGGAKYFEPVAVNTQVLADLREYIPLAPLHQPFALEAIEALLERQPHLLQVACFDTAFHHTLPQVEQMLPLPYAAWERGLRRYGFHGLSYAYQALVLPERHGDVARGRTVVAHLGSGASLCAMNDLKSVATTMGFSALDGLMMGTRCGALDPGAVIYLMEIEKLRLQQVAHVLYHDSGLLGVSCARSVHWWRCRAGWTCWPSRPASANTTPRSAHAFAANWAFWACAWTRPPTSATRPASRRPTAPCAWPSSRPTRNGWPPGLRPCWWGWRLTPPKPATEVQARPAFPQHSH